MHRTYQVGGIHGEKPQLYRQQLLHSLWSCLERDKTEQFRRHRSEAPALLSLEKDILISANA